jgi:cell wall assembly regulator SMI1
MRTLEELFAEIDTHHSSKPCMDVSEIDAFEKSHAYQLPDDLKAFYRRYGSVKLFDTRYGASYRFVPVSEMHPTRIDIYGIGADADEWGPSTWLTVCDVLDGNYIAIDVASGDEGEYNYIDCFHETFATPGESKIVAKSFVELLDCALRGGGDTVYYTKKTFVGYGDGRPLTAENAAMRIDNPEAPRKGWLVKFAVKGKVYGGFFGDDEYGGKEPALQAVRQYIEEARRQAGRHQVHANVGRRRWWQFWKGSRGD